MELRLPRTILGLLVGAALGLAGAVMQGVTRNPLADPGILGVNAGAALFVVIAISVFGITSVIGYVWFAFAGAAVATVVVYAIAADGGLSDRRVWADLGAGTPDGICLDAEGAVWYADVLNQWCARVAEGGAVLQTVRLDRGGFACALGGVDRTTLFIVAAEWRGMTESAPVSPGTGQVLATRVEVPGAGWP